jgi:endonuclease/exonuclease/phosphatase family metal-dependent hydrolase
MKFLKWILITFLILGLGFLGYVWFTSEHYAEIEPVEVLCPSDTKQIDPSKPIKILTWNIQFLAGKNYIFFYDAIDGSGKDEAPSLADTKITLSEVVRIIKDEDPDLVLLQEVDVDAKRTYHQDQVALIQNEIGEKFPCVSSTYYWKAGFVPHYKIMGSIGMKLVTFSKYKIDKAERHSLGEFPANIIVRQFRPKRAILDNFLPTIAGDTFHVLTTHLEAYAQGSDLMQNQVKLTSQLLQKIEREKAMWILGGDFNLLMPGRSYTDLSVTQRSLYQENSELKVLTDPFKVLPTLEDVNGANRSKWYSHFPNDPEVKGPDRTIDYIFYSQKLEPIIYKIRSHDTLKTSDHLPLIVELKVQSAVK